MSRPGAWLRVVAMKFCDQKAMTRVIDPIIADLQSEDEQAAASGPWRRRLVRARSHIAFWRALALHVSTSTTQPANVRALAGHARAVTVGCAVAAAVLTITAILLAPPIAAFRDQLGSATSTQWIRIVVYMIPQALVLALPCGLLIGATTALVGKSRSRRTWIVTVLVGLACALAAVATDLVVPKANQAFRELTYRLVVARTGDDFEPPPRGTAELTLQELSQEISSLKEFQNLDLPLTPSELALWFTYHLHLSLPVTPIVFGALAIGLSSLARRRLTGAACAFGVALLWYSALFGSRNLAVRDVLSPVVAAWAPNLVALLLASLVTVRTWRVDRDGALTQ